MSVEFHHDLLMGFPVEEMPVPRIPRSSKFACSRSCGREMWMAPSSAEMIKAGKVRPICKPCALEMAGDGLLVAAFTSEQMAEYEQARRAAGQN